MIPDAAVEYYRAQRELTLEAVAVAADIWGSRPPRDFDAWFGRNVDALVGLVVAAQQRAISSADGYVADALDEIGTSVAAEVQTAPAGLVGVASDGRELSSLLYGPVITTKGRIAQGAGAAQAWESGLAALVMRVQTQVADTARVATGLSITARPRVGYVRMLVGRSCSRCAVLAGRFYPYSAGFLRHPQCNCRHIPSREDTADDIRTDPRKFFSSLSEAEQDKVFTKAGAQAIRDGADASQVVNAHRGTHGLDVAGSSNVYGRPLATTTEGMTRRGIAGQVIRNRGRNPRTTPRLMPEAIYELATSRDDALRLLRMNGYVLDRPSVGRRVQAGAPVRRRAPAPVAGGSGNGPIDPPGTSRTTGSGEPPREYSIVLPDGRAIPFGPHNRPIFDDTALSKTLDGLPGNRKVGQHRWGSSIFGKTWFPKSWDDEQVRRAVNLTFDDPEAAYQKGGQVFLLREVDRVIVAAAATGRLAKNPEFFAAFPVNGDGVVRYRPDELQQLELDRSEIDKHKPGR